MTSKSDRKRRDLDRRGLYLDMTGARDGCGSGSALEPAPPRERGRCFVIATEPPHPQVAPLKRGIRCRPQARTPT